MRKLQQFYALKFSSTRLKKANYNINISFDEATKNGEVISISNSELIRTLFRYKKVEFSQKELDDLLIFRKKLQKAENNEENRLKIKNITTKIENILFVEDLINVQFDNKAHYLAILKRKGFYVNGTKFTPFMASAGMIRKNTAMFINNNIKHQIMDILENGRNETVPLVAAKFGAYFSLYSSSTLPVSFPNFAIVPDKEIETIQRVDFVQYKHEGEDDDVIETEKLLKLNAWDGQGLISPRLAQQWSKELELDYTFSCAVIRAPFLKGMVTVFDFENFAEEVAGKYTFVDKYGIKRDIRNIDLLISESMFKLWSSYESTEDYVEKCHVNKLGFAIAKVNPKEDRSYSRTSYQFLQVLKLNNIDIANLCEPTINWFRDIQGDNPFFMVKYATGENDFDIKNFSRADISLKAILLNPSLSKDRYIQERFYKSIRKKLKESHLGNILINANYQFMIGDPYYQACHIFQVDSAPLLKAGEHYSEYWLNRNIVKVGAIRSPIVHHSEFNILNFKNNVNTRKWYNHIHSGIIFPANGIGMDCAIHGGADWDGDIVCTINNTTMIKGKIPGLPIIYDSQKAEKVIVDSRNDKEQVECQLNGYNSKVGFATNISSSLYCLMEEFPEGSIERETISKRLKIGRVIQGEIIDGVKGLKVPPFRNHWVKYKRITDNMTLEEKETQAFNNKILCDIRPAFFRFLYPHYLSRYNKEIKKYNLYSYSLFGMSFEEIKSLKNKTPEQLKMINDYKKHSFFLDNESTMNAISHYIKGHTNWVQKFSKKEAQIADYSSLTSGRYELTQFGISKMREYLQEYKSFRRGKKSDFNSEFNNLDIFISYLRKQCEQSISSNVAELADYAIEVTYGKEVSMTEFVWKMFPDGILENILSNSSGVIEVLVKDENGTEEYLWTKYSKKEIPLEELYNEQ